MRRGNRKEGESELERVIKRKADRGGEAEAEKK